MSKIINGYLLSLSPYKEDDLIANVLTDTNMVSFKIRGGLKTNSKFISQISLFEYASFDLSLIPNSDKYFLKSADNIIKIDDIYENFDKNILMSFTAESILKDPNISHPFEIFDAVFKQVKNNTYNIYNIILIILKEHLISNGCFIDGKSCVRCGSKNNINNVSLKDGGFLCSSCNDTTITKSIDYMKGYRSIVTNTILSASSFVISKETAKELIGDFFDFMEESCGINLISKKLIINTIM